MRVLPPVDVVIPARDEASTIRGVVRAVPSWVREVVVVDNGSRDATAARAAAAGARVVRATREGYGFACVAALEALRDDPVVAFLVADGSDDPAELQRVTDPVRDGDADLVVGSRARGYVEPGAMHWAQRAGNLVVTSALSIRYAHRCTDLGPYRAMRRRALMSLALRDMTWGWTLEMQIKAARAGMRVREVPVSWRRRRGGAPKVSGTLRGTLGAGRAMIRWLGGAYLGPAHDPH
ncbi:MAG: glycosyltransferase family 2 protein [Polyangiales bacterium]